MKTKYSILLFFSLLLLFSSYRERYNLSTEFDLPTNLSSPDNIALDPESADNINLSWSGGGAKDGSYVTYEVLFDKKGNDFSHPIAQILSNLGGLTSLSVSQADMNSIARKAGIKPDETGQIIWTVQASKAGQTKRMKQSRSMTLTRGDGIDNIANSIYLWGDGTESSKPEKLFFRKSGEAQFVIYTKISGNANFHLQGKMADGTTVTYSLKNGKLKESDGLISLPANQNPYRITLDFNTLKLKAEIISDVKCIWGCNYDAIGNLTYMGNGIFEAKNCPIRFVSPDRPETNPPSWLTWVEERYYFSANIDKVQGCWGRGDNISPERPNDNEPKEFYELHEFAFSQWDHLWKMKGDLDLTSADITIDTNENGMMIHHFTNIKPLNNKQK